MIDYQLHIESGTHKKGTPYPEHELHKVTCYFNMMKESMNEHHQLLGTNEGIARQIDSVYNSNPEATEARYFYTTLKEVRNCQCIRRYGKRSKSFYWS
jgi:hypothetical protein